MHCMYNTGFALYQLLRNLKVDENSKLSLDQHIDNINGLKEWFDKEHEIRSMTQEQRAAQIASSSWYD